jgi:UDP-N-acetylglucosamine 2-epimerase (non-hydrolysing)
MAFRPFSVQVLGYKARNCRVLSGPIANLDLVALFRILFIFGTRPEAIKLCPVIRYFRDECRERFDVRICVTAQHRDMLDQVLQVFQVTPHYDLNAMRPGQTLSSSTSLILSELEPVLRSDRPDLVLVQGDTATTLCGALAAFYAGIPVGHVEAGLRTGDMNQPFPEEMNRVVVGRLASLHFAATPWAAANLRAEGVEDCRITVTGNTGIDAVLYTRDRLARGEIRGRQWPELDANRKLIVVTAHRRESFGEGFERICKAIREIADLPDVEIVYPVHPNPNVSGPVRHHLCGHPHIKLIEPLDYVSFVDLMRRSYLLLTDSGGIQEEAPSLGKPVLVLREKTERPEAVQAGTATLVGTDVARITSAAADLVLNASEYEHRRRIHNPYGDGLASGRIGDFISNSLQQLQGQKPA